MFSPVKALLAAAGGVAVASIMTLAPPPAHAQGGGAITCESQDGRLRRCPVPWRDARLVRQTSNSPCRRNETWGVDRGGIWVDRGCRGQFVPAGYGGPGPGYGGPGYGGPGYGGPGYGGYPPGGGWQPGPDWNRQITLHCESRDRRYQLCQVDVGGHGRVRLVRQDSGTDCQEGYSWGWNRAGVWVDRGCRGVFVVDRRW